MKANPAAVPAPSTGARAADLVMEAYAAWVAEFAEITARAPGRFLRRQWVEGQRDAVERLTLYRRVVERLEAAIRALAGGEPAREDWAEARRAYAPLVADRIDRLLAETFFNSVTRRLFTPVGLDPELEFGAPPPAHAGTLDGAGARRIPWPGSAATLVQAILAGLPVARGLADLPGDAALAGAAIDRELAGEGIDPAGAVAEVLPQVFYRNKGAFVVGRLVTARGVTPLVLALLNEPRGVVVDAVLLTPDEASGVFGFTRTYFHVDAPDPAALVAFLQTLMPLKRVDELYTAIGYNKHAKTELYRALMAHLEQPDARFEVAEGDKGLVMTVFALPSFNLVFKVIKDRFGFPKNVTRKQVMEKYHLVFVHDRVGRLADAHEFEWLAFPRDRFAPAVLEELLADAGRTVRVEGDLVVIRHLYVERRVVPLNLFLRRADRETARRVVLDYGNAIKDLAAANIFTGDMLLKNFGVTRHGRVIFYDYDELCLLTECTIREVPKPRTHDEEMSAEPWFHVGEHDVFPEEFGAFMSLPGELGELFLAAHGDLLQVEFWREMQARQRAGELVDFFAYRPDRRLRHGASIPRCFLPPPFLG